MVTETFKRKLLSKDEWGFPGIKWFKTYPSGKVAWSNFGLSPEPSFHAMYVTTKNIFFFLNGMNVSKRLRKN